jgi:hypothetical protein
MAEKLISLYFERVGSLADAISTVCPCKSRNHSIELES